MRVVVQQSNAASVADTSRIGVLLGSRMPLSVSQSHFVSNSTISDDRDSRDFVLNPCDTSIGHLSVFPESPEFLRTGAWYLFARRSGAWYLFASVLVCPWYLFARGTCLPVVLVCPRGTCLPWYLFALAWYLFALVCITPSVSASTTWTDASKSRVETG